MSELLSDKKNRPRITRPIRFTSACESHALLRLRLFAASSSTPRPSEESNNAGSPRRNRSAKSDGRSPSVTVTVGSAFGGAGASVPGVFGAGGG